MAPHKLLPSGIDCAHGHLGLRGGQAFLGLEVAKQKPSSRMKIE
jgi:hypothetical protein